MNSEVARRQNEILNKLRPHLGSGVNLSERVAEALVRVPRHQFVSRFRNKYGSWIDLEGAAEEEVERHLSDIYRDSPLVIWEANGEVVSTISQPSFVLLQLEMLDVRPGQRVYELGTGSGWNAGMIAYLCAPGEIMSFEIVPELAEQARAHLRRAGLFNAVVITGDGTEVNSARHGAFDRGIFTAGARDLPMSFHRVIRAGGVLLFVLQRQISGDLLLVLHHSAGEFRCQRMIRCGFVPVTGAAVVREDPLPAVNASAERDWPYSGEGQQLYDFMQLHPGFNQLSSMRFVWRAGASWVQVTGSRAALFGGEQAWVALLDLVRRWEKWGKPALEDFEVVVRPRAALTESGAAGERTGEVAMVRHDSVFLWRLKP